MQTAALHPLPAKQVAFGPSFGCAVAALHRRWVEAEELLHVIECPATDTPTAMTELATNLVRRSRIRVLALWTLMVVASGCDEKFDDIDSTSGTGEPDHAATGTMTTGAGELGGTGGEIDWETPVPCGTQSCAAQQICVRRGLFCASDPQTGHAEFVTPTPTCEPVPSQCLTESVDTQCLGDQYCEPSWLLGSAATFVDRVLQCGPVHADCIGSDTLGVTSGYPSTGEGDSVGEDDTTGDTTGTDVTGTETGDDTCVIDHDIGPDQDQCVLFVKCAPIVSGTVNCNGSGCRCETQEGGHSECTQNACEWTSPEDLSSLAACCGWDTFSGAND